MPTSKLVINFLIISYILVLLLLDQSSLQYQIILIVNMSLLSNLVQFGNTQSTSLDLCQSPKAFQAPYCPPIMSAQKQPIPESDRPRPVSKSLSKMSFFTAAPKIDPRQRIIHRLFYKMEMKCRKHYYNFFVKLQNIKKKPVNMKTNKLLAVVPKVVQRLAQIQQLLFSKYFQRTLVKESFDRLSKMAKVIEGSRRMDKMLGSRKAKQYFFKIITYSKQIQKNHIRIDILASSLKGLMLSSTKQNKRQSLSQAFSLIANYASILKSSYSPKIAAFQPINNEQDKIDTDQISLFTVIKELVPDPVYQQLKSNRKIMDNSPTKPCSRINLKICQEYKNPFQKANYLKACSIKLSQFEQPFQGSFCIDIPNTLVKKCEIDMLNSKEVNDIYDSNTLFFPTALKVPPGYLAKQQQQSFSQSFVQPVQFQHSQSQSSFISPLCQNRQINYLNASINSARGNSFGFEAVNFKNSLVSERQSMKEHVFGEKKQEKFQQLIFKKNNFMKEPKNSQTQTQQYSSGLQNLLKIRLQSQNSKLSARNNDSFYNKMMIHSSRQPAIQPETDKKCLQGRRSIDQPKKYPFKEDIRRHTQTFLKITKRN